MSSVVVPPHLIWPVWRVWLSGKATLKEIEQDWSIYDLLDANDALDLFQEIEKEAMERAKNGR